MLVSFENPQVKFKLLISFQSDMRNKDLMLTENIMATFTFQELVFVDWKLLRHHAEI